MSELAGLDRSRQVLALMTMDLVNWTQDLRVDAWVATKWMKYLNELAQSIDQAAEAEEALAVRNLSALDPDLPEVAHQQGLLVRRAGQQRPQWSA